MNIDCVHAIIVSILWFHYELLAEASFIVNIVKLKVLRKPEFMENSLNNTTLQGNWQQLLFNDS